ncbi:MAG: PfaD family polyunsaturated fatty acid/polyketide biosynthesis protein [Gemmatimonadetes bacterium]|nr:PfaD family polyunsaturated fatty acid/polyketide biosynthesis protein [Gemmatimonadota bacterium]MDA1102494.1 PfaD family polyunsaturated fatty acid/polyketide biosynthesis protein [Gemmatimonadota bacterium]
MSGAADGPSAAPAGPGGVPIRVPVGLVAGPSGVRPAPLADDGSILTPMGPGEALVGVLPPLYPEWLGDRTFLSAHGCRFPYVVGEMARGIASADMVIASARAGLMTFFGSAGLAIPDVEEAITKIQGALGPEIRNWGANLIHSPQESRMEMDFAELMLARGVSNISASAFMRLAPSVVYLSAKGLHRAADGSVGRVTHIFAKVSRVEVARPFLSPAPEGMLKTLVESGLLTAEEAQLAATVPVAEDITVEADSGGHTDNRPLPVLLPMIIALADEVSAQFGYAQPPRVGVGGGLGTPAALASAFAAGAAFVVTGSVNQATVESALSEDGRKLLAQASMTDVAMAPAADMFEMGVEVQVLKRGTMFAQRGKELYKVFRAYPSLDAIPAAERAALEEKILGRSIDDIWNDTRAFFERRDPAQIGKAEGDPKHKMALVFRWYLFMGAQWARSGETDRRTDYQIWCGPAMGAFNEWVKGSFLEPVESRSVVQIALNLLEGAAHVTRAHQLRLAGVPLGHRASQFSPRPLR